MEKMYHSIVWLPILIMAVSFVIGLSIASFIHWRKSRSYQGQVDLANLDYWTSKHKVKKTKTQTGHPGYGSWGVP